MHFVGTIEQIIEKDPGTNWLCIDFGTSATVAAYGTVATVDLKF